MAKAKQSVEQSFENLPVIGKIGLGVAVCVFIVVAYYFILHMSLNDDISSAKTKYQQLVGQMQEAKDRQQEYLRLREDLAEREAKDRSNLRTLPANAEMSSFLEDLNRLAELSGLAIRLVDPRPEEPDQHYVRLPVNLQLSGRYHQLARFFHNVSQLERAISMEDIRLADPKPNGDEVVLQVEVRATTFRRAGQARASAPPATTQGASS